jgi:hypothetical protein
LIIQLSRNTKLIINEIINQYANKLVEIYEAGSKLVKFYEAGRDQREENGKFEHAIHLHVRAKMSYYNIPITFKD